MAKSVVSINPKSLADLQSKINELSKFAKQELSNELATTALKAVAGMKANPPQGAPHVTGNLRNNIGTERSGQSVVIFSNAPYSPYVEFGTGRKVNLSELTKMGFPASFASQFKGQGIKEVNLPARPFFFTNIRKELGNLNDRLDAKLKQLTK